MILFLAALVAFLVAADPAYAGLEVAWAAFKVGGFAALKGTVVGAFLLRSAVSLALSLLGQAMAGKKNQPASGTQIPGTTVGEDESQTFVMGRRATGGHLVYRNSHGAAGKTPNAFLTEVIEVSDIGPVSLESVIIGDRVCPILEAEHPTYGNELGEYRASDGTARAWIKWYDGTQTVADPYLVETYGGLDDYEWSAQHVGTGTAYAILTYQVDREVWKSQPAASFVVGGIPLYDPRKDSSVGGSGAHRWNDPDTWEPSANTAVQVYNLKRGIPMPTGEVYGGRVDADDLPLANWVAGMNVCDAMIGDRVQFKTCTEVRLSEDEPADIIETLLRGALGQVAEVGGVWMCRFGAPAAPVYSFTDEDVSISDAQTFDPIKGLEATFNATVATYIEPEQLWQARTTSVLRNADWEAEDGGRLLVADVQLGAVASLAQAEQVKTALIMDERRQRQHGLVLPPDAMILDPLDDVQWTSTRNGYIDKDFEVAATLFRPSSGMMEVTLRERDPDDYDWVFSDDPAPVAPYVLLPVQVTQIVPGFAVNGYTVQDSDGAARRPAIRLTWDPEGQDDVFLLRWQVRNAATGAVVAQGVEPVEDGEKIVLDGILPGTGYEARAQFVVARPTDWTAWLGAVSPDVRLTQADLADTLQQRIDTAFDRHDEALADAEGTIGDLRDAVLESLGPLGALDPLTPVPRLSDRVDETIARLDFELPRLTTSEQALDEIYDRMIGLQGQTFRIGETLAGAGIYIDEASGNVRIAAFEAIAGRTRDLEVTLDAESGRIDSLSSNFEVNGQQATMTDVFTSLNSLQGQITDRVTTATFDAAEQRITTAEQQITALGDTASIVDSVEVSRRAFDDVVDLTDRSIADVWERWQADESIREATAQGRRDLRAAVSEELEAEASERLQLRAETETGLALLQQDMVVRVTEQQSLSQSVTNVSATLESVREDLDDAKQVIGGTADALDSFGARVTDTEDGLVVEAERRALLEASVGVDLYALDDALDDAVLASIGQVWNQWVSDQDLRRGVSVGLREMNIRVAEGLAAEASERLLLGAALGQTRATVVQESNTRAEQDRVLAEQIRQVSAGLDATDEALGGTADALESFGVRVADTEDGLVSEAEKRTLLEASVGAELSLLHYADDDAVLNDIGQVWRQWTGDQDVRAGVSSGLREMNIRVTEGLSAEASERLLLGAAIGGARSSITQESQARARQDEALAFELGRVQSSVADTSAAIEELAATRVTSDEALAVIETEISANFGSMAAMASATEFARATADGISAGYVWRLNGANVLEAVSVSDGTDGPVSTFRIAADYVQITGISQMDTAVIESLVASEAFIENLVVEKANIAEAAVGTLEIAGRAVTNPVRAWSRSTINITSASTWTTMLLLTIDRTMPELDITVSFQMRGDGSGRVGSAELRLERREAGAENAGNWQTVEEYVHATADWGRRGVVTLTAVDTEAQGAGVYHYRIRVRKYAYHVSTGATANLKINKRYMVAREYKK